MVNTIDITNGNRNTIDITSLIGKLLISGNLKESRVKSFKVTLIEPLKDGVTEEGLTRCKVVFGVQYKNGNREKVATEALIDLV